MNLAASKHISDPEKASCNAFQVVILSCCFYVSKNQFLES